MIPDIEGISPAKNDPIPRFTLNAIMEGFDIFFCKAKRILKIIDPFNIPFINGQLLPAVKNR
jgi:hypothetical protein